MSKKHCWAAQVSACRDGRSNEHLVSHAAWIAPYVSVGGLPRSEGKRRDLTIDALTVNALCAGHNSDLSPLDQAFADFVNCIREVSRLRTVREPLKQRRFQLVRLMVDGVSVERCILKMAMNLAVVHRDALNGCELPSWLPEVIFGNRHLDGRTGLALLARAGDQQNWGVEAVRLNFITKSPEDRNPAGIALELRSSLLFACTWEADESFRGFAIDDTVHAAGRDILLHPRRINHRDVALSLDFDWSGRWTATENPAVVKLRERYKSPKRK